MLALLSAALDTCLRVPLRLNEVRVPMADAGYEPKPKPKTTHTAKPQPEPDDNDNIYIRYTSPSSTHLRWN